MKKLLASAVLALAAWTLAAPAMATSYGFIVDYSGGGVAALDPSSPNNPLTTTLEPGDTFIYTLQAVGNGAWSTISAGSQYFVAALYAQEQGQRTSDFTLDLLNHGSIVFQDVETGVVNEWVHLGTNNVSFPNGLIFNTLTLTDSITSAFAADQNTGVVSSNPTGSTPGSLLPIFGAPEMDTAIGPSIFSFNANAGNPVPEPSTLILLGAGFAGLGLLRRRMRN
jgi:hypothetical protein